jgi:adenosylcobinamide-phosphate guanylyltransferase
MRVTAVVMAGGRGKRMEASEEKPMLRVGGKPVVEHVLAALQAAKHIESVVVAVSVNTPKTAEYVKKFPVKVLITPGEGYIQDMQFAVKKLGLETVLAVASDLPLITAGIVDDALERYASCGKPALTVAVPTETKSKLGLAVEYDFEAEGKTVVPTGINIIDGSLIDGGWMEQEVYILHRDEVAVNVNTPQDLQLAERLYWLLVNKS